jgi:hypothetical protein
LEAIIILTMLFLFDATAPIGPGPPHSRGFEITLNDAQYSVGLHLTSDKPVAETCYLTTDNTQNIQTYMPLVGFEPTISLSQLQRSQTYAKDRSANGTGITILHKDEISRIFSHEIRAFISKFMLVYKPFVPVLRRGSKAARLLRSWVRIPPGAWMFVVCVVCCLVEVSATSWSLVQRSPTDCGASLCVIKKPRERGGHSPRWAREKKMMQGYGRC